MVEGQIQRQIIFMKDFCVKNNVLSFEELLELD